MKKMLFITAFPPNRKTAGQNYSKVLLSTLRGSFDIDLIYFSYPNHTVELNSDINILKEYKVNFFSKLLSWLQLPFIHPFFAFRFRIDLMFFLIKNASYYDVIYFDFSQVFLYSFFCPKTYKVMMSHDVIYQKMKREKMFRFNPINALLFYSEKIILSKANLVLTFSKKDQFLIKSLYGIDSNTVSFFIDKKIKEIDFKTVEIGCKFVFYGAWNRIENLKGLVWFMENVFPFLNSNIKFEIIGPSLDDDFLKIYQTNGRVKYLGFVDNPYKIIAESLALVAPIFQGAGVKVKVIESLATGTSIIGTKIAFDGIDDLGNGSMINCETAADFIKIINEFPMETVDKKIMTKSLFELNYNNINLCDLLNKNMSLLKK